MAKGIAEGKARLSRQREAGGEKPESVPEVQEQLGQVTKPPSKRQKKRGPEAVVVGSTSAGVSGKVVAKKRQRNKQAAEVKELSPATSGSPAEPLTKFHSQDILARLRGLKWQEADVKVVVGLLAGKWPPLPENGKERVNIDRVLAACADLNCLPLADAAWRQELVSYVISGNCCCATETLFDLAATRRDTELLVDFAREIVGVVKRATTAFASSDTTSIPELGVATTFLQKLTKISLPLCHDLLQGFGQPQEAENFLHATLFLCDVRGPQQRLSEKAKTDVVASCLKCLPLTDQKLISRASGFVQDRLAAGLKAKWEMWIDNHQPVVELLQSGAASTSRSAVESFFIEVDNH